MTARLWLARHGATDWSDAGRLNGWTDVPLNETGREQARRLRTHLEAVDFAGVWASDLVRATETARLAAGDAVTDLRLRELDFGDLEGHTWEQCSPGVQEALAAFDAFSAPGGETTRQLVDRVLDFVDALPAGDHLLVTHGGVIRVLLRHVDRDARVEPGGIVRIDRGVRRVPGPCHALPHE